MPTSPIPILARRPLPRRHVLSRHSIPEHGARGDGCRTARTGCKTISGSSRDSTDAYAPFTACRPVSARNGGEALPSTMPETSTRFGANQARAGYRPGRLQHHDRQPRQRGVRQSRSAPPRTAMPRPSLASLAKASATVSPSSDRPPAKRRAAPWCAGWRKTSSRMQASLPRSTLAIVTSPSFQITKQLWPSSNEQAIRRSLPLALELHACSRHRTRLFRQAVGFGNLACRAVLIGNLERAPPRTPQRPTGAPGAIPSGRYPWSWARPLDL